MFCSQQHTGSHDASSLKVTDFFTDKKIKHAALIEKRLPASRMFSFPKKKKEKKKRKEQAKVHDLAFLLILRALQPALFSAVAAQEATLRTSTLKVTVFLHQLNKFKKKMQHYSKRSSCAEKVLFSKKKKKKTKLDDLKITFLFTLQALQPALFSAAAAREAALRAASRFSTLLAAASRFCCSIHGYCSALRTSSQILQPCDPGLMQL